MPKGVYDRSAVPEPVTEQPVAEAPKEPTVRVKLLKRYWPADGRFNTKKGRKAAHDRCFDAGDIIDLPVSEARVLLNKLAIDDVKLDKVDPNGRKYQEDYIRPPIAERADAIV